MGEVNMKSKDLENQTNKIEWRKLWDMKCKEKFNVVCGGSLFRSSNLVTSCDDTHTNEAFSVDLQQIQGGLKRIFVKDGQNGMMLVTGGEDAVVRGYSLKMSGHPSSDSPQMTMETKGGPIQAMLIQDVTKFYNNDLLVGDSLGRLTVICNQQILSHQMLAGSSINSLQLLRDTVGMSTVVASDDTGTVAAVLPKTDQWKIHLNSFATKSSSAGVCLTVTSLLTAELTDQNGRTSHYVLVTDNTRHLYIIHQGTVVSILTIPATVTAMCAGRFLDQQKLDIPSPVKDSSGTVQNTPSHCHQVALGTETGAVYLLHNFQVTVDEFTSAGSPITHLQTFPRPDMEQDLLLCCGHFNHLLVFHDGQMVSKVATPDWVISIAVVDVDSDKTPELVLGCLDKSIHAVKMIS